MTCVAPTIAAGRPLGEPIVQHDPFVMNTAKEFAQAVSDLRADRLGTASGHPPR
jgi:redox-sensitive bicupin YhaK (pirin superfamily)